jgi:ADP-ribose pyrophosphatase
MARELAEEIQQRPGRLVKLATFWNSPGFSTELTHVYIALDLSPCDRPDAAKEEEQDMTIERHPLADTGRLIAAGEITDAKTIIGLALAERYVAGDQPEATK